MNYVKTGTENKSLVIPSEVYSRISGYYRPVYTNGKKGQWNPGKSEEFGERKTLKIPEDLK
jgi:hypothetical protein